MSLLNGTLQLHDVQSAETFVRSIVSEFQRSRGAYLSDGQADDLHTYLIDDAWRLSEKYDRRKSKNGQTFSTYAGRILRRRIGDWYRQTNPGTRGGARFTFQDIDDEKYDQIGQEDEVDFGTKALRSLVNPRARYTAKRLVEQADEFSFAESGEKLDFGKRWAAKAVKELGKELVSEGIITLAYVKVYLAPSDDWPDGRTRLDRVVAESQAEADKKARRHARALQAEEQERKRRTEVRGAVHTPRVLAAYVVDLDALDEEAVA